MFEKFKQLNLKKLLAIICILSPSIYLFMFTNILNDWFWHTMMGEYIVNNGFPQIGIGSWYAEYHELPWIAHEWLSEVIFWLTCGKSQTMAIVFGKICALVYSIILTIWVTKNAKKSLIQTLIIGFLTITFSCCYIYARPHIFSYFLLIATIYVVNRTIEKNDNSCFFLLPISTLWVNVHGGSSNLVYAIPILYGLTTIIEKDFFKLSFRCSHGRKCAIKLLISGVLTIPCLLLNPYNFEMLIYPYSNMNDTIMLKNITEWATPSINSASGFIHILALFVVIFIFCNTKKEKIDAYDFLLISFGTFLFFKAERFYPYFSIFVCYVLPKYMLLEQKQNVEQKKIDFRIKTAIISFIFFFNITLVVLGIIENRNNFVESSDIELSSEVIEIIKQTNPQRLYNHFNFGGYLIYNDIPVFIDGRADMYTGISFDDFVYIMKSGYAYETKMHISDFVEKYDFDALLCYITEPMSYYYLEHQDEYELLYKDETCLFAVKKGKE